MNNSRLIQVFNTFSKKEARDLKKWLYSPAHNQREDVIELFEYLAKVCPTTDESRLDKEKVFRQIFPSEEFDDAKLRQSMHFLLKAVEEFFIYQELRNDEVRSLTALARVYRKRKLDRPFRASMRSARQAHDKNPYRNEHYQRNEFLLQLEEYAFTEAQKRTVRMNLQEVVNALETTFLADKLFFSCMMLAHQTVYKTDYDIGMLDEVLEYVESRDFLKVPAIAIYYYGYKATTEKDDPGHFRNLKAQILEHEHLFPASELRDIYLMAINYLISRMNSGDASIFRELFEFYKKGLEKRILIENETLSRFTFRNVVTLGLMLKEFAWVETFIHEYEAFLEEKYRESIVHYSLAKLNFERKDYQKAQQLLTQVEYDDILMNLNAKSMLLRIFYEEDELDALESLLDSMRIYMKRKKVMGYHKANFTNLVRLTRKMLKVNPFEKQKVGELRLEIEQANPMAVAERKWLLTQVDLL